MSDPMTKAAGTVGKWVLTYLQREAADLIQKKKTEQAIVDCLTQALSTFLNSLENSNSTALDSPYDFIAKVSNDKRFARLILRIFYDDSVDPAPLATICEASGLPTKNWTPRQWNRAVNSLAVKFVKVALGKNDLKPLFEAGERFRKFTQSNNEEDEDATPRERYLRQLIKDSSVLDLVQLTSSDEGAAITLDQVLIELNTTDRIDEEGKLVEDNEKQRQEDKTSPLPVLEAFERFPKMVLLGDPGSGKSTFAKELAILSAKIALEDAHPTQTLTADLLPVMVVLRDLVKPLAALQPTLKDKRQQQRQSLLTDLMNAGIKKAVSEIRSLNQPSELADEDYRSMLLILDGLDEVPFDLRALVREAVDAMLKKCSLKHLLITCRIRSYDGTQPFPGFKAFTLDELSRDQIEKFVKAWYKAQATHGTITQNEADKRAPRLVEATGQTQTIGELASNPLMLTTMGIIHRQNNELPEHRVRLYREVIDILLRRWKLPPEDTDPRLAGFLQNETALLNTVQRLAYEAHRVGHEAHDKRESDLNRYRAIEVLDKEKYLEHLDLCEGFLDYIDQHTGLLLGRGGEIDKPATYSFPHRIFQEFLAGCHIVRNRVRDAAELIKPLTAENDYWAVSVELAAEHLVHNAGRPKECLDLAYKLYQTPSSDSPSIHRANLWSAKIASKCTLEALKEDCGTGSVSKYPEDVTAALVAGLRKAQLPAKERAECGVVLNHFEDPRVEVTEVDKMRFALVLPGPFYLDEDNPRYELAHAFALAQYPVSNAQFNEFVEDKGYTTERFWELGKKHGYWSEDGFKGYLDNAHRRRPAKFADHYSLPNHPVVGLSWYEAMAFCKWLTGRWNLPDGCRVTLPSRAEWTKAARGGNELSQLSLATYNELDLTTQTTVPVPNPRPDRAFPWGTDQETDQPDANRCNCSDTKIGSTSALGAFATGVNSLGLEELAGNMWEWSRSPYKNPEERADSTEKNEYRVFLGGSYLNGRSGVGCSARLRGYPYLRRYNLGFRVSLSPFPLL